MRRKLLALVSIVLIAGLGLLAAGFVMYTRADVSTVGKLGFSQRLRVPPLLEATPGAGGRKEFDLTLQQGRTELLPGAEPAETWGVNGPYLGPTLRASRGDELLMHVRNDLPEATTLHWHGMELPAEADGGPHQTIESGTTWRPTWTVDQPASTLWYHPHLHGDTEDHVYRGVAGMFILDDPALRGLGLPDEYGVDDVPLILQDPSLSDDGSLEFSQRPISPIGRLGDRTLVNGTYDPYLPIARERVRFRLLNASTARIYDVGFADGRELLLVGTDGGLLPAPRAVRRVLLSPGERAEVVVEFRPGERAVLRSFEPDLGSDFFNNRFAGGDDSFDLLQVRAARELEPAPKVPGSLAVGYEPPRAADAVRTRRFELSGSSSINGKSMELDRIDEVVAPGSTEVWEVENSAGIPHSFHVHGVQFALAGSSGLKDTVFVPPGEKVRLVVPFPDYTDPHHPYMFHCHILEHEDRGMMGQFVITRARDA